MITITDEELNEMAKELQADTFSEKDYSIEELKYMLENWLLNYKHDLLTSTTWHVLSAGRHGDTVGRFREPYEITCRYFGWVQCKNKPADGSIFCEEHFHEGDF